MKKILLTLVACVGILSPVQAYAGDNAGYLFGGIIGGLILGDALSHNHRHHYYNQEYVYDETPQYVRVCRRQWVGYYDQYGRYIQQPRQVCEWEPR